MAVVTKVTPPPPPASYIAELNQREASIIRYALRSYKYENNIAKVSKEFNEIERIEVQFSGACST